MTSPPAPASARTGPPVPAGTGGPAGHALPFSEALHRFATALTDEARLRPVDVDPVRRSLLRSQQVLADTDSLLAARPDLAGPDLDDPLFITGFLRTGSTLLHNLLALHPDLHGPRLWELANPVEVAHDPASHPRLRQQTRRYVHDYYLRAPLLPRIHYLDADLPDECHRLLANTFHSMVLEMRYRVPSYGDWLHHQSLAEPYRWHRRQLVVLMSAHRREDGSVPVPVLKCPFHTWFLPDLVRTYPEARFIHLHRDLPEVVASTASLCRTVRGARSDHLDLAEIGELWFRRITSHSQALADARDELLADRPVMDVRYPEIAADPVGVVRRICRFLELPFPDRYEAAIRGHLAQNPARGRGTHHYRCQEFGLTPEDIAKAGAAYQRRFG